MRRALFALGLIGLGMLTLPMAAHACGQGGTYFGSGVAAGMLVIGAADLTLTL